MKRRQLCAALFGAMTIASTVAVPQAAADACRWIAHDLPVPGGTDLAETRGSSPNNQYIVGYAVANAISLGVVWKDGVLTEMASTGSAQIAVEPKDVNDSGVVVGRKEFWTEHRHEAFRYQSGTYTALHTEPNENSQAIGINNAGDVVGEVWLTDQPGTRQVVMWPSSGPRRSYLKGTAIGISDDREIVLVANSTAWVVEADSAARTELPGSRRPVVLDNDRVLSDSVDGIAEWSLDGQRVATWAGGSWPFGKTSSGTVFGSTGSNNASLWQWGTRYDLDSEQLPVRGYYGDATDGGALIGTYFGSDGLVHPARWFWCA